MRWIVAPIAYLIRLALWLLAAALRLAVHRRVPRCVAIELTGDIPDRSEVDGWRHLFARAGALRISSIRELGRRLDLLALDPRVEGVVVKVESVGTSVARLLAVRAHLLRFRAAGRRVVAYVRAVDSREYLLACAASTLYIAPSGRLDLTGFAAGALAAGAALRRAGVGADFVRRGEHKTAPELFTHDQVSPAQRAALEGLLDDLHRTLVAAVAEGRGLTQEAARAAIDAGPYTATGAVEAGLCDGVADGEDLEKLLAPKGSKPERFGTFAGWRAARPFAEPPRLRWRPRPALAVVPVRGVIKVGDSTVVPGAFRLAGSDSLVGALRAAREDPSVRAVLLAIDSRGGSALASELVRRAVERCAAEKPVVACVDRIAASGGYLVAVPAHRLVAGPTAVLGSIGVFAGKFEISGLAAAFGIDAALVERGAHASMLSPLRPFSASERAALEREIDETYRDFVRAVARGRRLDEAAVAARAEGRIFSGRAALAQGLVDELGGFEDAVARACELAHLEPDPALRMFDPVQRSLNPLAALRPLGAEAVWAIALDAPSEI